MPQDPGIIKISNANGSIPKIRETNVTMEELESVLREWVREILSTIDPPAGIWERIKHQAQRNWPMSNSYDP